MGGENRCVCCGEQIPEGTQVCNRCMRAYGGEDQKDGDRVKKAMEFERIMMDWVYPIIALVMIIAFILYVSRL